MRKRKGTRERARGLVVTFALGASACGGATSSNEPTPVLIRNPPQPVAHILLEPDSTLTRRGDACALTEPTSCPPNVPCTPPAPRPADCPPILDRDGTLFRAIDGSCSIAWATCELGPMPTCNPPPPRIVPCDSVPPGMQMRDSQGRCSVPVSVNCPRPEPICRNGAPQPVACPTDDQDG